MKMVKLLLPYMGVNERNSKGLTALDMFNHRQCQGLVDAAVGDILLASEAKTASQLHRPSQKSSLVEKLSGGLSYLENIRLISGLDYRYVDEIPLETRNILLVVAVLVVTATYQAALSPPGGFWQDNSNPQPAANNASTEPSEHQAGKMILRSQGQLTFLTANCLAFFTSLCMISALVVGLPFENFSLAMIGCMAASYYSSMRETVDFTKWPLAEFLLSTCLAAGVVAAFVFNRLVSKP
ncbi:uncharacterized protein LOC123204354 [Mangifera indica]|uniref:uncharacterized protein LOC123204354 n=1 Tax=Mangifera indica TaxID=29780 RepID=UPI001CFACFEC|nr:uncharacterized protein LOC123204354 [Mangifera indica]